MSRYYTAMNRETDSRDSDDLEHKLYMDSEYKMSDELQEKVLAHLIRDENGMRLYKGIIKPQYFTNALVSKLAQFAIEWHNRYKGRAPEIDEFKYHVKVRNMSFSKQAGDIPDFYELIERLYKMEYNPSYLDSICIDFARTQAVYNVMRDMIDGVVKMKTELYDGYASRIREAAHIGEYIGEEDIDLSEDVDSLLDDIAENGDGVERIATGLQCFDTVTNGGVGKGELTVIMGNSGRGKTTLGQNIVASAVSQGLNALHVSLENNKKTIALNYLQILTGASREDIIAHKNEYKEELKAMFGNGKSGDANLGRLCILQYPTRGITPSALEAKLEDYKGKGILFDEILADYPSIMAPETPMPNAPHKEVLLNYETMRGISIRWNAAVIAPAQANRGGEGKSALSNDDLAEAYAISNIADIVVASSMSDAEKERGIVHVSFPKVRDGQSGRVANGIVDWQTKRFTLSDWGSQEEPTRPRGKRGERGERNKTTDPGWGGELPES